MGKEYQPDIEQGLWQQAAEDEFRGLPAETVEARDVQPDSPSPLAYSEEIVRPKSVADRANTQE